MKLMFIGADHEVTGSCHFIEACGKNFIVDYGMEQGKNVFVNQALPVKESQIDFVLLTHAHVDHSGLLPLLYKNGFRGKIYATDATADLCGVMLRDCVINRKRFLQGGTIGRASGGNIKFGFCRDEVTKH